MGIRESGSVDKSVGEPYNYQRNQVLGGFPVAPMQQEILKALNGRELSMNELVVEIRQNSEATATTVKAAVLPLILRDCVEMTSDRKLRLHNK